MDRHRRRPDLDRLEGRALTAITGVRATAAPQVLTPPNNRFAIIKVSGSVSVSGPGEQPQANFQVVDEYRRIQTFNPVPIRLRPVPGQPNQFGFAFQIRLQATVRYHDLSARQYFITVAAREPKGSAGQVLPVIVPNPRAAQPPPAGNTPAARRR
jgi:hypothetical protein